MTDETRPAHKRAPKDASIAVGLYPGTFCGNPAAYPGCDPNAADCCIPFCDLKAPDCVAVTECQPWYDPIDVQPGYENLGACVVPRRRAARAPQPKPRMCGERGLSSSPAASTSRRRRG